MNEEAREPRWAVKNYRAHAERLEREGVEMSRDELDEHVEAIIEDYADVEDALENMTGYVESNLYPGHERFTALAEAIQEFADWHGPDYDHNNPALRVEVSSVLWDRVVNAARFAAKLPRQAPRLLPKAGHSE